MKMRNKQGKRLYVMQDEKGFCKIGISHTPSARLPAVIRDRGCLVFVAWESIAWYSAAKLIETTAHLALLDQRQSKEWFDVTQKEAINAITDAEASVIAGHVPSPKRLPAANAKTKNSRTDILVVRLAPALKNRIEAAAIADDRSVASLVAKALREWVSEQKAA